MGNIIALVIFALHPMGSAVSVTNGGTYATPELCNAAAEEFITELKGTKMPLDHFSVLCVDTNFAKPGDPA